MGEADRFVNAVIYGLAVAVVCLVGIFASAMVAQMAWNWSMPHLFALPDASYGNALGLTLLAWALRSNSVRFSKEG